MNICIQRLEIDKLGPLNAFQANLGGINLFYGQNETGKTFLVEFLLRSLFRTSASWALRRSTGDGKISVAGLKEDPVLFSPTSSKKLEDYWKSLEISLPTNMSRLLIVKGGELALAEETPGGVNRNSLKTALTSQAILDDLWNSIQHTVREAEIDHGQVLGSNMGKIKEHNQLREEMRDTKKLLNTIEENYSLGPLRQIELKLDQLDIQLEQQNNAKGHLGYIYHNKIKDLIELENSLSKEMISSLRDNIRDYQRQQDDLELLNNRLKEAEVRCKDLPWLEAAIEIWEEKGLDDTNTPQVIWGFGGSIILALGLILMILNLWLTSADLFWLGSGFSASGFGMILFYGVRLLRWSRTLDESRERQGIKNQFQRKFGVLPNGISELIEWKRELQKHQASAETTRNLIDDKRQVLSQLKQDISSSFDKLINKDVQEELWAETMQKLNDQREELSTQRNHLELKLGKLNLSESEFREKSAEIDYNPDLVEEILENKNILENEKQEQTNQLETLKARAAERTRSEITAPWIDIYYRLRTEYGLIKDKYQLLTAQIVAEIGLTEILTRLRDEEDQKINQALNTPEVSQLIHKLTGSYTKLDLENDQLFAEAGADRFAIQDLSTGAREQIQLGLRLGIASRISGGQPLFLILDDAFQHSDWQRREALVQSTINLAESGWQILYLTMDDHIRDLYMTMAEASFEDGCQLIELN